MISGRDRADAIGIIELELMKLVRHLETFGRRSSLYVHVDRAGYLAMRMLESLGPVSTNGLARALRLDASTVTRQVTALERAGYVARRGDPADRRASIIDLTVAGRQSMHEVERQRRRHIEALFSDWAQADQVGLGLALTRLNASLADSAPEPGSRQEPARALEPVGALDPVSTPELVGTPDPVSTPELVSTPDPVSTPELVGTPDPVSTPDPVGTPEPAGALEPVSTPEPSPAKGG
jgi:DNA-binding MarR family transcriptional regulator